MSKLIVKVGNFITESLIMQNLTDKKQIKQKVKSNLEGITFALILLIINWGYDILFIAKIKRAIP